MAIQNSSALTAPGISTLSMQVQSVDDLARLARVFAASGPISDDEEAPF